MSNGNTAVERLIEALQRLPHDPAKRPQDHGLRQAWSELGRAWIVNWATELARDVRLVEADLEQARAAHSLDDGLVLTENALWRLAAAREKLHAVIALAFGVPSLSLTRPRKTVPEFRVSTQVARDRLRALRLPEADAFLAADTTLKGCLLLRHQLTHSLAPIVKAPSVTWLEVGYIRGGGVYAYEAKSLIPGGLQGASLTPESLFERALRQVQSGLDALQEAATTLASLIDAAAELEPPPIIWHADETGLLYATREEASAASRANRGGGRG